MVTFEQRRERLEATVRVIDMVVYATVLAGGFYALLATPLSVVDVLEGAEWLVPVWSGLLIAGGLVGLAGRATRYWMVEVPGTVLSFFGTMIYLVMLGRYAFASITASVAAALVVVALCTVARRWVELQIFSSDPDDGSFASRLAVTIRRRTSNFNRKS